MADFPHNETYGCSSVVNSLSLGERRVDLSYFVYSYSRLFIFADKTVYELIECPCQSYIFNQLIFGSHPLFGAFIYLSIETGGHG